MKENKNLNGFIDYSLSRDDIVANMILLLRFM